MKKKIFTLLALFACVLSASAQGFTVKDVEMVPGSRQYKINLDLNTAATFVGCSFSISLPAGVTPVMETKVLPADNETEGTKEQSVVKCDLSSDFDGTDTYVFSNLKDGKYNFVVLPTKAPANLKPGTVMSVYVQGPGEVTFTDGVASVDKTGKAADIVFAANVSSQLVDVSLADVSVPFKTYRLGDVKKDGNVNVDDYLGVAGLILKNEYSALGDVKAPIGVLNVDDFLGVANIILGGSVSAPVMKIENEIEPE